MLCDKAAGARRIARTLGAIGGRLRVASWTTELATDFVGAVRRAQRLDRSVVFVGILAAKADDLSGQGREMGHPLLEGQPLQIALRAVCRQLDAYAAAEDDKARRARRQDLRARLSSRASGFAHA